MLKKLVPLVAFIHTGGSTQNNMELNNLIKRTCTFGIGKSFQYVRISLCGMMGFAGKVCDNTQVA